VNAGNSACAFAALQKRVFRSGTSHPAEAALHLVFIFGVLRMSDCMRDFHKLFPKLVIRFFKDTVGGVTSLHLDRSGLVLVDVHLIWVGCISDFFDSKLDPANFEDVLLLNFVVLKRLLPKIGYNFFVVSLERAHYQIHVFIEVGKPDRRLARLAHVLLVVEIATRRLEIENLVAVVYNFEQRFVVLLLGHGPDLLFERAFFVVVACAQLVPMAHDNNVLLGLHRLFGQVPRLVVKKAMRVPRPRDTLHEDPKSSVILSRLTRDFRSCRLQTGPRASRRLTEGEAASQAAFAYRWASGAARCGACRGLALQRGAGARPGPGPGLGARSTVRGGLTFLQLIIITGFPHL